MPRTSKEAGLKLLSEPRESEVSSRDKSSGLLECEWRWGWGREGGNHFRSSSFLAVAGMRSVPQVGLQRPLEAPFPGSRSRVLAAARACVREGLLHRAWGQHHAQETARPGKAAVCPTNPNLGDTLQHNLTCIWSFPGSELAGRERQRAPGSWTNPRARLRRAMPEG